jgi:hypothetical protein
MNALLRCRLSNLVLFDKSSCSSHFASHHSHMLHSHLLFSDNPYCITPCITPYTMTSSSFWSGVLWYMKYTGIQWQSNLNGLVTSCRCLSQHLLQLWHQLTSCFVPPIYFHITDHCHRYLLCQHLVLVLTSLSQRYKGTYTSGQTGRRWPIMHRLEDLQYFTLTNPWYRIPDESLIPCMRGTDVGWDNGLFAGLLYRWLSSIYNDSSYCTKHPFG